jgi:hypothetical protein
MFDWLIDIAIPTVFSAVTGGDLFGAVVSAGADMFAGRQEDYSAKPPRASPLGGSYMSVTSDASPGRRPGGLTEDGMPVTSDARSLTNYWKKLMGEMYDDIAANTFAGPSISGVSARRKYKKFAT